MRVKSEILNPNIDYRDFAFRVILRESFHRRMTEDVGTGL